MNSEDALGGRDPSSLEMHSEAVTERVWRCTCRVYSSETGGVLGGGRFGGKVYAVLGVCCTRCMLHSVLTHDYGMERWRGMT